MFFRTCRATGVRPESSGARACRLGPGTSGRRPFRLARLRGLALPAQPPLTPRVGNQGGKRDEPGLTAKAHAGSCGKPNPRTRQGRRGRRDARDARRASRKWTRPACGSAATRTKSVTAIETRLFAPGKFQPENVFGREEGVSSRRVSRVE